MNELSHVLLLGPGIVIGLIVAAPIGPVNLICIRRTFAFGPVNGFVSGLGAALGDGVFAAVTGLGLTWVAQLIEGYATVIELAGAAMLVYFGFTYCPDVCPTELFQVSEILRAMGKDADRINAYFVSVDPERDTRAAMKDYLSSFDPHLKGLTGDPQAVAKVISDYRVYARKVPLKDGDYTMDHTALIYLMDRDGKFVSPFRLDRKPEEAAADLKHYL